VPVRFNATSLFFYAFTTLQGKVAALPSKLWSMSLKKASLRPTHWYASTCFSLWCDSSSRCQGLSLQ
jgi:hypothetical protein